MRSAYVNQQRFSGLTEIYSCLSPGDSGKMPGPLVRRTMSQSSNAKTADNSVIAVSRIVCS
jgi:hypothetical protein